MASAQLAFAAASAAQQGDAANSISVVVELAMLTPQLSHEHLQAAAAQATLESLSICGQHAQGCVKLLLEAARAPEAKADLAADSIWALQKLASRCAETHVWMLEAGALHTVRHAMCVHSAHKNLVQCCLGIVFDISGRSGLTALIDVCITQSDQVMPDSAVSALVWSVYDLIKEDRYSWSLAELAALLQGLLSVLRERVHVLKIEEACCLTIEILVAQDIRLSELLLELGGLPLLLNNLRHASEAGWYGESIVNACVNILGLLASGSDAHGEAIRQHGGALLLAQCCCSSSNHKTLAQSAVWALGHLSGLEAVLEVMGRAPDSVALICGGLDTITEVASHVSTPCEFLKFPLILRRLLELLDNMHRHESDMKCRKKCVAAICSIMTNIAPLTEPGQVPELDLALQAFLALLKNDLLVDVDAQIFQLIAEYIGRVVLLKPSWKKHLQQSGADLVLSKRIQSDVMHRRLLNYSFWCAAALYGLPFVCRELHSNLHNAEIIDAAFRTIIDVLDDDVEGEWVLTSTEQCSKDAIPSVLMLVTQAMNGAILDAKLQMRGCHCIALLVPRLPAGTIPRETTLALFTAAHTHPHEVDVIGTVFYAFNALLVFDAHCSSLHETSQTSVNVTLCEGGADVLARQAISHHGNAYNSALLEEAIILLCRLSGIAAVLKILLNAGSGPVRTIGIKGIAEFGRQHPGVVHQTAGDVIPSVLAMADESAEDETLQQNVALLVGLCGHCRDIGPCYMPASS